jgi:hypothetical protein
MTGPSTVPEDMDGERWLRPIRAFVGAKDFRVAGKLATAIWSTLRLADEGHETVLPALRRLHVQSPGPCTATAGLLDAICRPASTLQSSRTDRLF